MITYGTEPMPSQLLKRVRDAFPKARLLQTFGTSETGITQTSMTSSTSTDIKIDDPNTEWKVVEGELWIKSQTQILGYLNAAMDRFTSDGWFKTGDLANVTADGTLQIKGRVQELINIGGEKVLPVEIETVLLELSLVNDCMVYGASNAITGQMVCADVVLKSGDSESEARSEIRRYCLQKLERYKVPSKINFVAAIPRSSRFKKTRVLATNQG